ncbi:unnamed protein product, partial [Didymodactylos carnosus]
HEEMTFGGSEGVIRHQLVKLNLNMYNKVKTKFHLNFALAEPYIEVLNRDNFVSNEEKSNHQLWTELCELISKSPSKLKSTEGESIIRQGIEKYKDHVGQLWTSLADYYIRADCFEKTRDIFEEAIDAVLTVFDAYAQSEEGAIIVKFNEEQLTEDDALELEIHLARLEYLMDRRPLLLLYGEQYDKVIETYARAAQTIDLKICTGKLHELWISLAQFYDSNDQLDEARYIYDKGTKVTYRHVDDLACVWCAWCEIELKHENYEEAIRLIERATVLPRHKGDYYDVNGTVQMRLHKTLKLWSFYVNLEECYDTFGTVKDVYDRIIHLKIVTPQTIINYTVCLEDDKYYEDAFRTYEKGIALFKWPNVYDMWLTYLCKLVQRYSDDSKLERTRDLFEQYLEDCQPKYAKNLNLLYAKSEEKHGLDGRTLKINERATEAVEPKKNTRYV